MILYEVVFREKGVVSSVYEASEKEVQGRLDAKIVALRSLQTREEVEQRLSGVGGGPGRRLRKLRITGRVAKRLYCYISYDTPEPELTFLVTADKKDNKLIPKNAEKKAGQLLQELLRGELKTKELCLA